MVPHYMLGLVIGHSLPSMRFGHNANKIFLRIEELD